MIGENRTCLTEAKTLRRAFAFIQDALFTFGRDHSDCSELRRPMRDEEGADRHGVTNQSAAIPNTRITKEVASIAMRLWADIGGSRCVGA